MKLIKIIVSVALMLLAHPCNSENLFLHALDSNGNWVVFSLDKVDRLEYKNGAVLFSDAKGNELAKYDGNKISQIQISEDAKLSGLDAIAVSEADKVFTVTNGIVACSEDGIFQLFDINGKNLVSIPEYKMGQGIDLSYLTRGIYLITINNKAIKIRL